MVHPLSRHRMAAWMARELDVASGHGLEARIIECMAPGGPCVLVGESGQWAIGASTKVASLHRLLDAERLAVVARGPIDWVVTGAQQVDVHGNLHLGGASLHEAVSRARRVMVVMEHLTPEGDSRLVHACEGRSGLRAHRIVTDLGVIEVEEDGLYLREVAPGVSGRDVQDRTEPTLRVDRPLLEMTFG